VRVVSTRPSYSRSKQSKSLGRKEGQRGILAKSASAQKHLKLISKIYRFIAFRVRMKEEKKKAEEIGLKEGFFGVFNEKGKETVPWGSLDPLSRGMGLKGVRPQRLSRKKKQRITVRWLAGNGPKRS